MENFLLIQSGATKKKKKKERKGNEKLQTA